MDLQPAICIPGVMTTKLTTQQPRHGMQRKKSKICIYCQPHVNVQRTHKRRKSERKHMKNKAMEFRNLKHCQVGIFITAATSKKLGYFAFIDPKWNPTKAKRTNDYSNTHRKSGHIVNHHTDTVVLILCREYTPRCSVATQNYIRYQAICVLYFYPMHMHDKV